MFYIDKNISSNCIVVCATHGYINVTVLGIQVVLDEVYKINAFYAEMLLQCPTEALNVATGTRSVTCERSHCWKLKLPSTSL